MRRNFQNSFFIVIFLVFVLSGVSVVLNGRNRNVKCHGENKSKKVFELRTKRTNIERLNKLTTTKWKHVTKSLSELPRMDERNAHTLFLNTIPKSGSEILILLLKWLQGQNSFKHIKLKKNRINNRLTPIQQENLTYEVENTLREKAVPLTFDKEVRFLNFSSFGKQSPTFLTIVRNPLALTFARYPTTLIKKLIECEKHHLNCSINNLDEEIELNIPYFCGFNKKCSQLNSKWALNIAKSNVERYYPVVGVLEEINKTIICLENKLSFFFKGADNLYKKKITDLNQKKMNFEKEAIDYITLRKILKNESEFYEWIKFRLLSDCNNKKLI